MEPFDAKMLVVPLLILSLGGCVQIQVGGEKKTEVNVDPSLIKVQPKEKPDDNRKSRDSKPSDGYVHGLHAPGP
jgi:hypothetical protein